MYFDFGRFVEYTDADKLNQILEQCADSIDIRQNKKIKLIQLVNEKFDKLTDESVDKLITWLEERK